MKTILTFNRSVSNWCDSHKLGLLIALLTEMTVLAIMMPFQYRHHFYREVYLGAGIEVISAVLLVLALRKPSADIAMTLRQKIWVTVAALAVGTLGYCAGVVVTIHFFTHRDVLNIIFNP